MSEQDAAAARRAAIINNSQDAAGTRPTVLLHNDDAEWGTHGLTKFEWMYGRALQGVVSNPGNWARSAAENSYHALQLAQQAMTDLHDFQMQIPTLQPLKGYP